MEMAEVSWAATELSGADLGDAWSNRRLVRVAERLGAQPGASIPVACNGWAETQAAYCWLAHEVVMWERMLTPLETVASNGCAASRWCCAFRTARN